MILFKSKKRLITLLIILFSGFIVFFFGLGSTGLVDETPPLFASAGRAMSESGDWLTPKVNGMFRFDKPPLIYWLMGFFRVRNFNQRTCCVSFGNVDSYIFFIKSK